MPTEPWTLQPSSSASSLGSADSTRRSRSSGAGVGLGVTGGGRASNISNKPIMTSRSSTDHRLSSSNSDTLLSSSEDESTTLPRARGATAEDVSQLAVASNPFLSVSDDGSGVGSSSSAHTMDSSLTRASPPTSERQRHKHHYYQQQQPQQQQYGYGYFDASSRGTHTPGNPATHKNNYAETGVGVGSDNSSCRAAETIIHFPDQIPTLQLVSFTPPPSPPVEGPSSSATPHFSYAHNYPHPNHRNADAIALPSSSSAHHHPLPTTATTTTPSHIDDLGAEHSSKFQAIRKRFSLGAMGAGGTRGVVGDRIGRRTSLTNNNNNNSSSNHKEPVRQWTKDSTMTLTSESTTALLMREDLRDDSSHIHNRVGGVGEGGGGVGLEMNGRIHSVASGTIHFQESDYAGVTRRGSTMTSSSGNTQTTYRLNANIPHTNYYSEKGGYGHPDHHGYDTNSKSNPALNLSALSPTATTPNTPRDSIFGQAGSNNNNNQAPNGKRYIDT